MNFLDVNLKNVEVKKNTEATISCIISMISTAMTISWSGMEQNDSNYVSDSKFDDADGTQTGTLTVKSEAVTADKTYTCIISSVQNPASVEKSFDVELLVYG